MAKIRFCYDNEYSKSTTVLIASTAASALPAAASQNPDRTYVWRSLQETGVQTMDIDFGSVKAVTGAVLANVRLLGAGVVELYQRGDAVAQGAAVLVGTFPAQDADTRTTFLFFASQSHRHWMFKWTNPTAVSDYAELGHAFIGTYVEPTVNVSVPLEGGHADPSAGVASVDGQKTFTRRTRYAAGVWTFTDAPEADFTTLRTIHRSVGVHTPLFVVLDATLTWTAWLCRFSTGISHRFADVSGRYTLSAGWEEAA